MINKFIPIIVLISTVLLWEVFIFWPQKFLVSFTGVILILFLVLFKLGGFKLNSRELWLLSAPPLIFAAGLSLFLLFLNSIFLQHALVVLSASALYFYLRHFFKFLFQITKYKPLSLEGFSSYFNIISFLFLSVSAYGFINFLNVKLYYLALAILAASFVLSYQFLWINKIDEQHNLFASILMGILSVEFFWSISLFPVSHFVSGLALAILYYVIINLTLLHFLEKLDKRLVKIYISVGVFCILAILLSAKWL